MVVRERGKAMSRAAAKALETERLVEDLGFRVARLHDDDVAAARLTAELHQACGEMHKAQLTFEHYRQHGKAAL